MQVPLTCHFRHYGLEAGDFFNRLNCFSASSAKILGVESCPLRPSESQVAAQIK